jgi:hypothetical protein
MAKRYSMKRINEARVTALVNRRTTMGQPAYVLRTDMGAEYKVARNSTIATQLVSNRSYENVTLVINEKGIVTDIDFNGTAAD